MKEPTAEELAALEKLRAEFLGKNSPGEILRGFEIVRFTGRDWDVVGRFKPNELAVRQAATDMKWMQGRAPYDLYELRAVISVPANRKAPTDAPLVLEADENTPQTPTDEEGNRE